MGLIYAPEHRSDESGFGYYRRVVAENGLAHWSELTRFVGLANTRASLMGSPEAMQLSLGLPAASTSFAADQERVARGWGGLLRLGNDVVCPACLKESIHIRHAWDHTFSVSCASHRTQLIERCNACSHVLDRSRSRIEFCPCGQDLRCMDVAPASDAQHWLSSLIASGGRSSSNVEPSVVEAELVSVTDLVRTLCRGRDPSVNPSRGRTHLTSLSQAIAFLHPLDSLLADWPAGFESHVSSRISLGREGARTLNSLLGVWYAQVKSATQGNPLQPFLESVVKVASDEFDGVLSLDSAENIAASISGFVRASSAATAIGVSRDAVVKAVQAGRCEHRTRRFGTRGLVYEVPRSEVARIGACRRRWVSEAEACKLAGVTNSVLSLMIDAGVICSDALWRNDIEKGGAVLQESIETLHGRLESNAKVDRSSEQAYITWAEFTSRRLGDRQAIQSAMKAAASGELRPVVRGRRLGDVAFLKSEVSAYLGTSVPGIGMTVNQLAKLTGWKGECISHWIDVGLLRAEASFERGQRCSVVSADNLLAFRQSYMPLADLARAMDTKSSSLTGRLLGIEFVGARLLPNGARRGHLVRIADLGRLAEVGAGAMLFPFQA